MSASTWRKPGTMARVRAMVAPAFRPRSPAAWMVGPSAIGSVNGMPISIRSAPAPGMPCRMAVLVASSGSYASRNGISAPRPSALSAANRAAMRLTA